MTLVKKIFFWAFLLLQTTSFAQIPERPNPPKLVNDYVGLLSDSEKAALEAKLVHFADSTSNQIAIIIIDDLGGMEIKDFGTQLGAKWGIGQKKLNNGVVIILKPTDNNGKKEVAILPGYGLEGAIPDLACKRILEDEAYPNFKQKNFYKGLDQASTVLMKLASGEIKTAEYAKKRKKGKNPLLGLIPILLIVILVQIFKTRSYANSNGTSFWTALFLMSTFNGGGGSWGSFNGGGDSDSGFGGFGGGDFGGGGASGGW